MVAKIPNDIFQFSTTGALYAGFSNHGPVVSNLQGYGTHGIGTFARQFDELLFLDGQAYQITSNEAGEKGNLVEKASEDEGLSFVMVTDFKPEYQIMVNGQLEKDDLLDVFSSEGGNAGGKNCFIPFRLHGEFSKVTVTTGRWVATCSTADTPEDYTFSNIKGTIFGFAGPQWMNNVSVTGPHCYFLADSDGSGKFAGGRVEGFVARGEVELNWSVTGRFHLGFPRGESWDDLDIATEGKKLESK